MTTDERTLYLDAFDTWGETAQVDMVVEECAELITAIQQLKRGRGTLADIASEVADVEIMCGQLRLIVGSEAVDAEKQAKLRRLRGRIDEVRSRARECLARERIVEPAEEDDLVPMLRHVLGQHNDDSVPVVELVRRLAEGYDLLAEVVEGIPTDGYCPVCAAQPWMGHLQSNGHGDGCPVGRGIDHLRGVDRD